MPYLKKLSIPIPGIHLYKNVDEGTVYIKIHTKMCRMQLRRILKALFNRGQRKH